MTLVLPILTVVTAVVAAVRSTWSPCGRSMLSTITPIGERGRRGHFGVTAGFFIVGSVLGGAALGAVTAVLAAGVSSLRLSVVVVGTVAATASFVAAASDGHLTPWALPIHRRQVNERWLDTFRPWFYGFGFGAQIGTGLATYITSAAVYLFLALAVVSGRPAVALTAGLVFGAVRGASVLLARHVRHPDALRALHRRVQRLDGPVGAVVVACEAAAGVAALALTSSPPAPVTAAVWMGGAVIVGAAVAGATVLVTRRTSTASPR